MIILDDNVPYMYGTTLRPSDEVILSGRKAITISRKKSKEELYADFLSRFPNMEQEVKRYFLYGDDLKIYTKHGGKFVFHLTNDSFELKAI